LLGWHILQAQGSSSSNADNAANPENLDDCATDDGKTNDEIVAADGTKKPSWYITNKTKLMMDPPPSYSCDS